MRLPLVKSVKMDIKDRKWEYEVLLYEYDAKELNGCDLK